MPERRPQPRPDRAKVKELSATLQACSISLDQLEERLVERGASVKRYAKPTFTKPAPIDLRHEIATECDAVVEALAD